MRNWMPLILAGNLAIASINCMAAVRATVAGSVVSENGQSLGNATVMVYSAHVRKGYNIVCPTCWLDCGKRTTTNNEGQFSIGDLDPQLVFTLLAVDAGHKATFIRNVDPANGAAERTVLHVRISPDNPAQVLRGLVVDDHGGPVRDAAVEPQGASYEVDGQSLQEFGAVDWIDPLAVTNEKGEFEIVLQKPARKLLLSISPRGMATKLVSLSTGTERRPVTVTDGATIQGRLVRNGTPVPHAELGLRARNSINGMGLPEMRIGTRDDGTFSISNVPAGRVYYLYGTMDSLAGRNLDSDLAESEPKQDGDVTSVGDIQVRPAFTLRGRVLLSGGATVPPEMHLNVTADQSMDSQSVLINPDGSFEVKGLSRRAYDVVASVKGYSLPEGQATEVLIDHNETDLLIALQPFVEK